jgi:hypothetical protein
MTAEPAEPALVICPHCHGWTCEDCGWQGVLVSELIEADVIDDPQLGDPAELPEDATLTLGERLAEGMGS